jgi:hypothetical protein
MGLYNSTMAISGLPLAQMLNVNHCLFSIRPEIWMSNDLVVWEAEI